jgi:DNA-binding beta-propeller fold protein YncE
MWSGSLLAKVILAVAGAGAAAGAGAVVLTTSGPLAQRSEERPQEAAPVAPVVWTLAGEGPPGVREPVQPGWAAPLNLPTGLAVDRAGNLYVADHNNEAIKKIDPQGNITTVAGGNGLGLRDGPAREAQFNGPNGLAVGPDGSIYVADSANHRIRRVTPDGRVETVAGSGPTGMGQGDFADGPAGEARFSLPKGVAVAEDGTIYVADTARVRVISPDGVVRTLAGSGEIGLRDGKGPEARLSALSNIALGPDGALYVVDQANSAIRRVTRDGEVTTLPIRGLKHPAGVAVAKDGTVYVTDTGNYRVVALTPGGAVRVVAGTGERGYVDGPAERAQFGAPGGLVLHGSRLYVADDLNHRIRVVEPVP